MARVTLTLTIPFSLGLTERILYTHFLQLYGSARFSLFRLTEHLIITILSID